MTATSMLLVLTTLPDDDTAQRIANDLVEAGLAACVSIGAPVRSVYRWQGAVEQAVEVPLAIKTTADRYDALEQALCTAHPYELPEIIALPVERGLEGYLRWMAEMTADTPTE
ncbi:MAG: divalent-cation tolerance protein CutA [Methyloversatilis sp.]|jgi:periplasmic divalent cation tolerance protein|nr:divalent-cation tolerance protein CutA [Methyloversatilis sp.]MBP6195373.1 divalent-cation tolerance protein CutA [Methyloversatilis sp.]MBP9117287.1 divalent-cation tolerance protein CutA [Methyloversatilis sp.]